APGVADRTRRGVPPAAPVPESNCASGAYAEVLPEVRDCRDRACDRNSAAAGAARARTIDAEDRFGLLLQRTGENFSGTGPAARAGGAVCGVRGARDVQRAESRDDSRVAGEWMRGGGPRGAGVLRGAGGSCRSARRGEKPGAEKSGGVSGGRVRRDYHQRGGMRFDAEGIHAPFCGRGCGARAGGTIYGQGARRVGVSGRAGPGGSAAGGSAARDLSGFMPSVSWTESARGAAEINSGRSRRRAGGNAIVGAVLRVGGSVQRDGD